MSNTLLYLYYITPFCFSNFSFYWLLTYCVIKLKTYFALLILLLLFSKSNNNVVVYIGLFYFKNQFNVIYQFNSTTLFNVVLLYHSIFVVFTEFLIISFFLSKPRISYSGVLLPFLVLVNGSRWADQELLWNGFWNWDFTELSVLLIVYLLYILIHKKINNLYSVQTITLYSIAVFLFQCNLWVQSPHTFATVIFKMLYVSLPLSMFLFFTFLKHPFSTGCFCLPIIIFIFLLKLNFMFLNIIIVFLVTIVLNYVYVSKTFFKSLSVKKTLSPSNTAHLFLWVVIVHIYALWFFKIQVALDTVFSSFFSNNYLAVSEITTKVSIHKLFTQNQTLIGFFLKTQWCYPVAVFHV